VAVAVGPESIPDIDPTGVSPVLREAEARKFKEAGMKRLILIALLGMMVLPFSASAQYENTPADQMVREWYRRFLRRDVDPGSAIWVDALKRGQSPDTVLSQILGSTEYYVRTGSTAEGFVRQLHTDLTGRVPGPRETQFWVNQVYRSDRQDVAYSMLQRYPQNYGSGYPGSYSGSYSGSGSGYPYEYRRPYRDWPYRR
jgi:hypothetical protein